MDRLQKVFKTLSDPTRVRVLALLERQELAVQELMDVLGMAQSRVSRHLAILREAGLLKDRRDGTYVFYRFEVPDAGPWRDAWELVRRSLADEPTHGRDLAALAQVLRARAARTRSFFDAVGAEWDALRSVFDDDALRAQAITRLVEPGLRVADVGTGTGILACELARLGLEVVAIDHSQTMLDAARAKIEAEGLANVELRHGEANALPLGDGEMHGVFAHMVLQHLPSPLEAIREMIRALAPGGVLVVVDFVAHEHEWMREKLGVTWLGFEPDQLLGWFRDEELAEPRAEARTVDEPRSDLPATFIAWARRPS